MSLCAYLSHLSFYIVLNSYQPNNKIMKPVYFRFKILFLLSGLFFFIKSNGQVIYRSLGTGITTGQASKFDLDLDQDGTYDLRLQQEHSSNASTNYEYNGIFIYFSNSVSRAISVTGNSDVAKLDAGVIINSSSTLISSTSGGVGFVENGVANPASYWTSGVSYKYLGFAVSLGGSIHYGWLSLSIPADFTSFTIDSYSFNLTADDPITTGQYPVSVEVASVTQVTDIGDNSDGSDVQVSFTKAADETNIASYRLLIFPPSIASTLYDINKAIYYSNYVEIIPDGSNHTFALSSATKDVKGDLITIGISYSAVILSVPNTNQYTYSLSNYKPCYISTPLPAPAGVTAADVSDNSNASDISITISKALDETNVDYYLIYVVPSSQASTFDWSVANPLTSGKYMQITKTGSDITLNLSSNLKDINGDPITNNVPYKVFAATLTYTHGYKPTLSDASNEITLSVTSGVKSIVEEKNIYSANENIYIKNFPSSGEMIVRNVRGVEVYKTNISSGDNIIDASVLTSGFYIIEVYTDGKKQSKKMIR